MPQHETITFFDSTGHDIPYDSLPDADKLTYDSLLHLKEVWAIENAGKNDGRDDTYMPFLFLFFLFSLLLLQQETANAPRTTMMKMIMSKAITYLIIAVLLFLPTMAATLIFQTMNW